jgi:hypothetical protein
MRLIAAALVVVLLSAGSASAATPVEAVRQLMAGAPGQMPQTVRCVTTEELQSGEGRRLDSRAVAVAIRTGRTSIVLLDWRKVCRPLHLFRGGHGAGRVEPALAIQAMTSVLHEKAHVNGVRVEWKATCWAIPAVLEQLRRWGYATRQLNAVRRYLTTELDRHRTSEYKLRGRCRV